MKIAITGRSSGIGKALGDILEKRNHIIVPINRRDGENIRRTAHTANIIEPCDGFINNAQSSYGQTELLYAVWNKWQGQKKWIWNISTMMTEHPVNSLVKNQSDISMSAYRNQKLSLEEAALQLQYKNLLPNISIIRPGKIDTQGTGGVNVTIWAEQIIDIFVKADKNHCKISQISLGPTPTILNI